MNVLTPQAVRAAEVVLEQTNHGAEGMQHEPPADEPGGICEAIRKPRRSGIQQQPRRADAIGRQHDDGRPLEMRVTVAIDVFGACDQSVGIRFEPANACPRHELGAALHELRPMRDVHGALGAFGTAPHAGGTLLTRLERAVGARRDGVRPRPPMPAELIVCARHASAHRAEGRGRQRRTLPGRKRRIACQSRHAEVRLDAFVEGREVLVGQRPVVRDAVERAHAEVGRHVALPVRRVNDRAATDRIEEDR